MAQWDERVDKFYGCLIHCIKKAHGEPVPANVIKAIEDGRYPDALKGLIKTPKSTSLALANDDEPEVEGEEELEATVTADLSELAWTHLSMEERVLLYRSAREIRIARGWQNAFAAAGIVSVAYVIFYPNFSGSPVQLVSIFLWAFTLDVGVGALATQVEQNVRLE